MWNEWYVAECRKEHYYGQQHNCQYPQNGWEAEKADGEEHSEQMEGLNGENHADENYHGENQADENYHGENHADENYHGENYADENYHGENYADDCYAYDSEQEREIDEELENIDFETVGRILGYGIPSEHTQGFFLKFYVESGD